MSCYLNYKDKLKYGTVNYTTEFEKKHPYLQKVGLVVTAMLTAPLLVAFIVVGWYLAVPIMVLCAVAWVGSYLVKKFR
jgi:hypothetical protein